MFKFHWKYKDFEIRTEHEWGGKPYLELFKNVIVNNTRMYYMLAYCKWGENGCDWHFIDNRIFETITENDIPVIWEQLGIATATYMKNKI